MPFTIVRNDITRMAVDAIRHVRHCNIPLSADWKRDVDTDYQKRGK